MLGSYSLALVFAQAKAEQYSTSLKVSNNLYLVREQSCLDYLCHERYSDCFDPAGKLVSISHSLREK